jgi:hypothetical protein
MENELRRLLERLEQIGDTDPELFDSDVRQVMSNALVDGLARLQPDFTLPSSFKMFSAEADEEVRKALQAFLDVARRLVIEQGLTTFHERLAAIQNRSVVTAEGNDYDEFFGTSNPAFFNENGEVIRLM